MITAVIQKIKEEVKREILEEFISPFLKEIKDPEGEYRPEFVRKILKIARSTTIPKKYHKKTFLKSIS